MELQERLKTHWKEYLQDGLQRGGTEEKNRILSLLKQGYTVEQLEALLSKEAAQSRPQTR